MRYTLPTVLVCLSLSLCLACSSSDSGSPEADGDTNDGEVLADGDGAESEAESEEPAVCAEPIEARTTPTAADTTFDLGPYLMHTTKESAVVMWRTLTETDGKVVWGVGDALDHETAQEGTSKIHEITLTGLTADTRYAYKVVSGGVESGVHHLHAAPQDYKPVRFVVGSDSQGHPEIFGPIVAQMLAFEPFFMLHAGDSVQTPLMGSSYDPFRSELFDAIRPMAHEVPFYEAIGNHEKESQDWYDLVSYPGGIMDADHPKWESTYSFRYGNVFVLVINTNQLFLNTGSLAEYIEKAVKSEAAQTATWRVAIGHEPGYTDAWSPGDCAYDGYQLVRTWFLPLLGANNFHVYFSGHTHNYQRGQSDKVLTIITGGLGGGLDEFCKSWPEIQVSRYVHHHLQVEAGCTTMKIRTIDTEGKEIDHVTLDAAHYGELADAGPADEPVTPTTATYYQ